MGVFEKIRMAKIQNEKIQNERKCNTFADMRWINKDHEQEDIFCAECIVKRLVRKQDHAWQFSRSHKTSVIGDKETRRQSE